MSDKLDVRWGEKFIDATQIALRLSLTVFIILSQDYVSSKWTAFERGAAIAQGKKILPILIDNSILIPPCLSTLPYLDANEMNAHELAKKNKRNISNNSDYLYIKIFSVVLVSIRKNRTNQN